MALLFTYGTLQSEEVQQELFGRKLKGKRDFLKSFQRQKFIWTKQNRIKNN